jgi:cytoskeletal protein RodZ
MTRNLEMRLDSSFLSSTLPAHPAMKLTTLAFTLCFALTGLIGFVAWQAHIEAREARKEVRMFRQQQNDQLAAGAVPAPGILDAVAPKAPTAPPAPPSLPPPPPSASITSIQSGATTAASTAPSTPVSSNSVSPVSAAGTPPAAPASPPLTAQQSQLIALPAIARIKEAFLNDGFVLIDAGANKNMTPGMQFDVRRGASLMARVTVTASIEADEAIADIQPQSVPTGVQLKAGDELVQVVSPP